MKLYSLNCEEINLPFRLDIYLEASKEVLPNVQALIQDTEERVVASLLSGIFLDLQEHVDLVECQ